MTKIIPPDRGVKETVIGGKSYYQSRQGSFEVTNSAHVRAMKAEGFFEASLMGATTQPNMGFTCVECGFGSWFRKCSRCGHLNGTPERDGE
jgi:hypothetical protein